MGKKKCGVLFSGGKDSMLAAFLAKKEGHELSCLINIYSQNKESYMFHTPSVKSVKKQAEIMEIPLVTKKTEGRKEEELIDLKIAIKTAIKKYGINGIITGAVESVYQSSRIQEICNKLKIECFNPLWQKNQEEILKDLLKFKFKVIIVGVAAYPLDSRWLGREIDNKFIRDIKKLNKDYKISIAGEGGEFESFVINCPLFKRKLKIKNYDDSGSENSCRREVIVL